MNSTHLDPKFSSLQKGLLTLAFLSVFAIACTPSSCSSLLGFDASSSSEEQSATSHNPLAPGQEKRILPLSFQPVETVELELQRWNPETGESWRASFIKKNPDERTLPIIRWEISAAPAPLEITDRHADSGWIQHFLDLIQTLERKGPAAPGTLSAFGLDRPRAILRLKSRQSQELWLSIGDTTATQSTYVRITDKNLSNSALTSESVIDDVSLAEGAAFEMLRRTPTFESLRLRRISTWDSDDIDTLRFKKSGKQVFFAQRLSDGWGDEKNVPSSLPISEWLEQLTHLRATAFSDELAAKSQAIKPQEAQSLQAAPRYEIELTDRSNQITKFTIHPVNGKVLARWSTRENTLFELEPDTLSVLETFPPRKPSL